MPQLILTANAVRDLENHREYIREHNAAAAKRLAHEIIGSLKSIAQHPYVGRCIDEMPLEYRQWVIEYGKTGFIASYRVEQNAVVVLSIKHQKQEIQLPSGN
ncbi:type II toxin-antitoxin system RelE/ParE family toxin [Chrysiogenes arsenatis]|uniref:type II toxin-antitoxin system RelE/ParE family toxin n=1 Tax=Chrysiogenes arsenatis TaxID=309797 RepID=UPI00040A6D4C|nr:type II toxin-antitoxin system RelE/ParE family toxin [Chrysiogenes arsenatis]